MINLSKEFKIGLVTILSGLILFFGIEYLKGINVFKPENYYYVKYNNVTGLSVSSPVTIDGFKVGLVRSMEYDYNDPGNVIVELSLDKKLKIPQGSKATATTDLFGTTSIQLHLNKYVGSHHEVGDVLEGEINGGLMGKVSDDILPQVEQLLPRLDSILVGINHIVSNSKLDETLLNVNSMTAELNETTKSFNKLLKSDVPQIMNNFKTVSCNFAQVSNDIKEVDINAIIASAHQTIDNVNSITAKINSKDNSVGLLLNSDGLYQNINTVLGSTDSLLVDLKKNPKRYVHFSLFGRK